MKRTLEGRAGGHPRRAESVPRPDRLARLCDRLGYRFADPALLELALTHGSASADGGESNERLEFVGDSVVGLAVASALYRRYPEASEGALTQFKAHLVNNARLAEAALASGTGECLRLGKGEEKGGGRQKTRVLADALEAVFGAAFFDGGMEAASRIAERWILPAGADEERWLEELAANSKSALQEWLQARGRGKPEYVVVASTGPSHRPVFDVEARCGSHAARGRAKRKRDAQQLAAARVLRQLVAAERGRSASAAA